MVRIELCVFHHVTGLSKTPSFKPEGGQNGALFVSPCSKSSKVPSFKHEGGQNRPLCVSRCNKAVKGSFF